MHIIVLHRRPCMVGVGAHDLPPYFQDQAVLCSSMQTTEDMWGSYESAAAR